jgi:zinc D-Ala-D-Ala carboxypeptidase
MKLSEHFDLNEFTRSDYAKRNGINNLPNAEQTDNIRELCINVLEPIRKHFQIPILISSGFRSKALNTAIGGTKNSQHTTGEAVDIDHDLSANVVSNRMIFDFIKSNLTFDQMIAEFPKKGNPDWVHVSFVSGSKNRNQILVAKKENGKTIYINYKSDLDLK